MQHWIISIVRVFKQAADALFFSADGTSCEDPIRRPDFHAGVGSDHDFGAGGGSIDVLGGWTGLDSPVAPVAPVCPAVNVDGTPMIPGSLVDVSGKPFGVTGSGTGLGDSFGNHWSSGPSSTDWSSSSGSSFDWSSSSSWSGHDW